MQTLQPLEVIVVDCSYEPFSYRHPLVHVIRASPEISLGAARNIGIKVSRGDALAFMDDDALATRDWVEEISRAFSDDVVILGGRVEPVYSARPPKWSHLLEFQIVVGISLDHLIGCNMVVRKELFEKIGYFGGQLGRRPGTLLSNEEVDFVRRAQKLGVEPKFSSTLRVLHKVYPCRLTLSYLVKRLLWQGVSDYVMLHREVGRLRLLVWSGLQVLSCARRIIVPKDDLHEERVSAFLVLLTMLGRLLGPAYA
jgi:glycosyltransferase involved in cell wall biosynthesis